MFRSLEVEYSIFGCIKGEGSRIFDFSKGRDHLGIDEEGGGGDRWREGNTGTHFSGNMGRCDHCVFSLSLSLEYETINGFIRLYVSDARVKPVI